MYDMSMKLSFRVRGDITIFDAEGPYSFEGGFAKLLKAIEKLIKEGRKNFLLNLAGIRYIDCAGLGQIIRGFDASVKAGGTLKLLSPSQSFVTLLTVTHLDEEIEMYSDESAALSSFKS